LRNSVYLQNSLHSKGPAVKDPFFSPTFLSLIVEVRFSHYNAFHDSCPDNPVTKRLLALPLNRILLDHRTQLRDNLLVPKRLLVELRQTLAVVPAAKVDVVRARCFADKGDLGVVGTGAAVGASCELEQITHAVRMNNVFNRSPATHQSS